MGHDFQADFDREIDRGAVPALKWRGVPPGADLFAAGVADMDFPAAPAIRAALAARLEHGVFGYEAWPDTLLPALTAWQARHHGWQIDPAQVRRAPNVLFIIATAITTFSAPGEGVIIQPPVFFDFTEVIRENHRRVVKNPLIWRDGRYQPDFEGLERLAAQPENRILILCSPHNPVGRVWSRDELARLDRICRAHDVLVVADEIHADITLAGARHTPLASLSPQAAANTIACLSPAKAFNIASCCQAFAVIADSARRDAWQAASSAMNANKNNAFSSAAMVAAFTEGGDWLAAVNRYLAGNLDLLEERLEGLEGVRLIRPEGTFLAWLDFRASGLAPAALAPFLRERAGWIVTPGSAFGPGGAGFARVNFACPRPRLERALARLARALNTL